MASFNDNLSRFASMGVAQYFLLCSRTFTFSTVRCVVPLIQVICRCGRRCAPCSVLLSLTHHQAEPSSSCLALSPAVSQHDHTVVTRDTHCISGRHTTSSRSHLVNVSTRRIHNNTNGFLNVGSVQGDDLCRRVVFAPLNMSVANLDPETQALRRLVCLQCICHFVCQEKLISLPL